MTTISKSCFKQNSCLTKLLIACSLTWWIQGLSSTCPVFKYFQGLEFRRTNSSTFKDFQGCVGTLRPTRPPTWSQCITRRAGLILFISQLLPLVPNYTVTEAMGHDKRAQRLYTAAVWLEIKLSQHVNATSMPCCCATTLPLNSKANCHIRVILRCHCGTWLLATLIVLQKT